MSLLELKSCSIAFGGLRAVSRFCFSLRPGELVGLIGPNGAGKTTIFNLVTGVYRPREGEIHLDGSPIHGLRPFRIGQRGIARTFQNIRLFGSLSVLDNVAVVLARSRPGMLRGGLLRTGRYHRSESGLLTEARELLAALDLAPQADRPAASLPYGQQRRLEIARALAAHPRVLLLDEPAAGMNPQEKAELMRMIRWLREHWQLAIWLIEHDMPVIMGVCERIVVLDHGEIIAEGRPEDIQRDPKVIAAYLGEPQTGRKEG